MLVSASQSHHALQWRCIRPLVLQPCCGALDRPPMPEADGGITYEVDPDFLEHVCREAYEQPEPPGDV